MGACARPRPSSVGLAERCVLRAWNGNQGTDGYGAGARMALGCRIPEKLVVTLAKHGTPRNLRDACSYLGHPGRPALQRFAGSPGSYDSAAEGNRWGRHSADVSLDADGGSALLRSPYSRASRARV